MLKKKPSTGLYRTLQFASLIVCAFFLTACGGDLSGSSSSSSGSSGSSSSGSSGGAVAAGRVEFEGRCAGCHASNNDGTFAQLDVDNLNRTSLNALGAYIDDTMPLQDASQCVGECAENTAAYLRSLAGGTSSSSSSSSGGSEGSVARGQDIFEESCAACHSGAEVQGLFDDDSLRDKSIYSHSALATYIDESMPLGDAAACSGQCADDVVAYIATWHMVPIDPRVTTNNVEGRIDNPVQQLQCTQGTSFGNRTIRLLTKQQYQRSVEDLLGVDFDVTDILPTDGKTGVFTNNNNRSMLSGDYPSYMAAAQDIAEWSAQRNFSPAIQCGNFDQNCASNFINDFAPRLFRRPLSNDERNRFLNLANGMETNGDVREGIELALGVMLSSPEFLYRHEIGEANNGLGNGAYELTPYEIAAFLSYSFTNSTPDNQLLDAARNGQLNTDQQIRSQAARLLDSNRATDLFKGMVHDWLDTNDLDDFTKNDDLYPNMTQLYPLMKEELSLVFSDVMLDPNESFRSLYAPGKTFVDGTLSQHYGDLGVFNNSFAEVSPIDRGGLLLSGAYLTLHGDSSEASPIRRAVNVRRDMLCQDVPAPPEGVDVGRDNKKGELAAFLDHPTTTNRMAFQRLTEDGTCRGCHAEMINPLGFGLEDYDTVGRYRTADTNGNPIDPSGAVFSPYQQLQLYIDPERDTTHYRFDGGQELGLMMAEGELSNQSKACLSMQVMSFTSGLEVAAITDSQRPDVNKFNDEERAGYSCDVQDMIDVLSAQSPREMLENLGTLESVRYRKAWTR